MHDKVRSRHYQLPMSCMQPKAVRRLSCGRYTQSTSSFSRLSAAVLDLLGLQKTRLFTGVTTNKPHVSNASSGGRFTIATHTEVWKAVIFYSCDLFFILFRKPNLGRPATDLAEIWHADRKLVLFMNAGPKEALTHLLVARENSCLFM